MKRHHRRSSHCKEETAPALASVFHRDIWSLIVPFYCENDIVACLTAMRVSRDWFEYVAPAVRDLMANFVIYDWEAELLTVQYYVDSPMVYYDNERCGADIRKKMTHNVHIMMTLEYGNSQSFVSYLIRCLMDTRYQTAMHYSNFLSVVRLADLQYHYLFSDYQYLPQTIKYRNFKAYSPTTKLSSLLFYDVMKAHVVCLSQCTHLISMKTLVCGDPGAMNSYSPMFPAVLAEIRNRAHNDETIHELAVNGFLHSTPTQRRKTVFTLLHDKLEMRECAWDRDCISDFVCLSPWSSTPTTTTRISSMYSEDQNPLFDCIFTYDTENMKDAAIAYQLHINRREHYRRAVIERCIPSSAHIDIPPQYLRQHCSHAQRAIKHASGDTRRLLLTMPK